MDSATAKNALKRMGGRLRAHLFPLVAIAVAAAGTFSVVQFVPKLDTSQPAQPPEPVPVESHVVELVDTLDDTFEIKGVVEPERIVDVRAELGEQVERIGPLRPDAPQSRPIDKGDPVEEGQILVRLRRDRLLAEVQRVEAQLAYDRNDLQRKEQMRAQGVASEEDLKDAQRRVEISAAALKLAEANLDRTTIRAPISGTLNWIIERGEQVQPGTRIAQIVDDSKTKVVVDIPEREIAYFSEGQTHEIIDGPLGAFAPPLKARLTFLSRVAGEAVRATHAELTLDPAGAEKVRNGQIVTVRLKRRTLNDALMIPLQAVIPDEDQRHFVHVVEQGRARRRRVALDTRMVREGAEVRVVSGLVPGDRLVVEGTRLCSEGQLVRERRVTLAETPLAEYRVDRTDGEPAEASLVDELAARLEGVEGVLCADVPEADDVEIPITIDPRMLALQGLSAEELIELIDSERVTAPGAHEGERASPLKLHILADASDEPKEIRERVLAIREDGRPIYVHQLVRELDWTPPTPANRNLLELTVRLDGATQGYLRENVLSPLEAAVRGLPDLERVESDSRDGWARVRLTFERDVDLGERELAVAKRVLEIRDDLPPAAGRPVLTRPEPQGPRLVRIRAEVETDREALLARLDDARDAFLRDADPPDAVGEKTRLVVVRAEPLSVGPNGIVRAAAGEGKAQRDTPRE